MARNVVSKSLLPNPSDLALFLHMDANSNIPVASPHHLHHDPLHPSAAVPSPSSENTFLMSSPVRVRSNESYRPRITTTVGQRPACLVSASVTYVGNNEIYAFGGFDAYTDEVYNHVLRLNLESRQWSLVDNYGDIPGVRMGHTATLWQGDKVLIFGGENEHRAYLSDLIIFDLKTAYWHQPDLHGTPPRGRARHAAVMHENKLFIVGGLSGQDNNTILDEFCFLDLKTWTWSKTWRFVPRFDHTCWIWGGRMWVFGGLTEGMERAGDIWWLDLNQSSYFNSDMAVDYSHQKNANSRQSRPEWQSPPQQQPHPQPQQQQQHHNTNSGYAANSSSVQVTQSSYAASRRPPMAPGTISSSQFVSGPNIPSQSVGAHFHAFSSGCLLDFVTPAVTGSFETSLSALDLESMRWEKLADGKDLFNLNYRWHYSVLNQEGTRAWLLGCPVEPPNGGGGEYLSDVLSIDLRKLGLLGNSLASDMRPDNSRLPPSDSSTKSHIAGIGADLAKMFDKPPTDGSSTDFVVTAEPDDLSSPDEADPMQDSPRELTTSSQPIHVHRLILEARWPHFARMIAAQMAEFHTRKLHIPEPYSVVRAFLLYLYTDSITASRSQGPTLEDVAGMLVMSNCYDMPRLRTLCRNRLYRELDVDHAAVIWERAGTASEEWLRRRAARFCMDHWGKVVRTPGFQSLRRSSMMELCQEFDIEGRIVVSEEVDESSINNKFGAASYRRDSGTHRAGTSSTQLVDEGDEADEDENMDM